MYVLPAEKKRAACHEVEKSPENEQTQVTDHPCDAYPTQVELIPTFC